MNPTVGEIIESIEEFAPKRHQEEWDNTGWQLRPGDTTAECTGVMLCLDITPPVVAEAVEKGCNLIVSHHPLLFRGLKQISPDRPNQEVLIEAIRKGIYIYSSHTALDSTPGGVSHFLARELGLTDISVLAPKKDCDDAGPGVMGSFAGPMPVEAFLELVKKVYEADMLRFTPGRNDERDIRTVGLCSGSGGEFIPTAIARGADAYITSDVRYHDFLDYGNDIMIVDVGHFESEICTKSIFSAIISKKFPTFAVRQSHAESNPVRYC